MFKSFCTLALAGLLAHISTPSFAAVTSTLPNSVAQALTKNKLPSDALSMVMIPLTTQGNRLEFNADTALNPASTMKLVTTYAALELLGPSYQWRTEFLTDGTLKGGTLEGNLYLKGGGDPKLNMEKLWLLLRDLRANGVQHIKGDLILDRSYFQQPDVPEFNDDGGDANKPFLVTPDSLLVNLKAVRFITRADDAGVRIAVEPPMANIRIENRVKALPATASCPGWPEVSYNPIREFDGTQVVVSGQLPIGCSSQIYLALLDHPGYAAGAVRAIWQELGGTLTGHDRLGEAPKGARLLARAFSPDLVEVIRDINKYSNNTMARQLFLSIGAHHRTATDSDDAAAADRVIRALFKRKGIDTTQLVLDNGSGLSRIERISARALGDLLHAAWQSPYAAEFTASMPIVAVDGTMRKRLRNTAVAGQAHIKTGTLNNVRAIAGFSRDKQGDTWAVVAIINHSKPWGASAVLDQALIELKRR